MHPRIACIIDVYRTPPIPPGRSDREEGVNPGQLCGPDRNPHRRCRRHPPYRRAHAGGEDETDTRTRPCRHRPRDARLPPTPHPPQPGPSWRTHVHGSRTFSLSVIRVCSRSVSASRRAASWANASCCCGIEREGGGGNDASTPRALSGTLRLQRDRRDEGGGRHPSEMVVEPVVQPHGPTRGGHVRHPHRRTCRRHIYHPHTRQKPCIKRTRGSP
jgi:hypothetical protein